MSEGKKALEVFYNQSKRFNTEGFPASFEDFRTLLKNSNDRSYQILEDSLSNAIEAVGADSFWGISDEVETAMTKLANQVKGKLPRSSQFIQALSDKFTEYQIPTYAQYAQKLRELGQETVSEAMWWKKAYKPILIGGGVLALYITLTRIVPNTTKLIDNYSKRARKRK